MELRPAKHIKTLPSDAWERIHERFDQPNVVVPPPPPPPEQPPCAPSLTEPMLRICAARPVVPGEEVDVLIQMRMPEFPQGERVPVDIICVLDISGSMSMEAKIQSSEGSGGLNLLDVAKHGVKTVMHALQDQDRLALVLFDSFSETCWELTEMTTEGRQKCEEKLKDVNTRGATNIWNGLAEGLRVCRQGQGDGSQKRLAHLILLTDGQTAERNEVLPRMMNAKSAEERLPCTVSTFGFGYNIDSKLLVDMAHGGFGVYSFIPDAGFVGTIFVNYISNILTTMSLSAMLVLDPEGGEIHEVYGGLKVEDAGNGCKRLDLPTVQYGQSKDIVLRMSAGGEDAYLSAKATYTMADGEERETPLQEGLVTDATSISEVSLQLWRSRFADLLEQVSQNESESLNLLSDLSSTIQQKSLEDGYDQDPFILHLLQDLQGEAIDAVELAAFMKWGRHYLPSLMFAHRRQMCNNFKDPGVQHYGGEMFQALRDEADEKFNQLPPPEPTRSNVRGYTYSAPPVRSMAMYNDASAG